MARAAYSSVGRYQKGLWLVANPKGKGILANRAHLPAPGTGYKYYWLGTTQSQVSSRIGDAIAKLNVNFDPGNLDLGGAVRTANRNGFAYLNPPPQKRSLSGFLGPGAANWITQNWPFLVMPGDAMRGPDIMPGETIGAGARPQPGAADMSPRTPDSSGDTSGDSSGDSSSGDSSGDSGGGGKRLGYGGAAGLVGATAFAITSPLDFLKFIAWIFHPRNILRMVEFLIGVALMAFGLHAALQGRSERIEGFTTSEGALTRSGLGRVATELGAAARAEAGGSSGRRPRRARSAPHATRRRALRQRYEREEDLSRRRAKNQRRRSP